MTNFQIDLNTYEIKSLKNFLKNGLNKPIRQTVNEIAAWGENKLGENATKEVYSQTESNSYRRTGALRRGRRSNFSNGLSSGNLEAEIIADSRIGGAQINYSPMVNDGFEGKQEVRSHSRRTKNGTVTVKAHSRDVNRAARPFVDKTFEDTKKEAPKLARKVIQKYLNNSV